MKHASRGFSVAGGLYVNFGVLTRLVNEGVVKPHARFKSKVASVKRLIAETERVPVEAFVDGAYYKQLHPKSEYLYHPGKHIVFAYVGEYNLVPTVFTPNFTEAFIAERRRERRAGNAT